MFKQHWASKRKDFFTKLKENFGRTFEKDLYVFERLFSDLEGYYTHGKQSITEVIDSFFDNLFRSVFPKLNPVYAFDDE